MPATIQSIDDLLVHAGAVELNEATWEDVDLDSLNVAFSVVVRGEGRDDRIDARSAAFVLDLQKELDTVYAQYVDLPRRAPLIKVKSSEGSTKLTPDFTEVLKEAIQRMPPEYIAGLIALAIVGTTGYYVFARVMRARQDDRTHEFYNKALETVSMVVQQAVQDGHEPMRPIRRLVQGMRRGETVAVAGGEPLTKREVAPQVRVPRGEQVTRYVHGDGQFSLLGLSLKNAIPGLLISQGNKQTTALLERLDPEVKENLLAALENRLDQQQVPYFINLQIDVYYTEARIQYAVVVGVGAPRPDLRHFSLAEIPSEVPNNAAMLPGLG